MPALSAWSPEDGVLGAVVPLALAAAGAGTALVVDLDPAGPRYPSEKTLAHLVAHGPRRDDLEPRRRGLAVLANGGVASDAAAEVVEALVARWPVVVLRLPAAPAPRDFCGVVPIIPLLPGSLFARAERPAVYQQGIWRTAPPGPGVVLRRPRPSTVNALLRGVAPIGDRWVRQWRAVWRFPWR